MNKFLTLLIIIVIFALSIVFSRVLYQKKIKAYCKGAFEALHAEIDKEKQSLVQEKTTLAQIQSAKALYDMHPAEVANLCT